MPQERAQTGQAPEGHALYFRFVGECVGLGNNIPNKPGHIYFGVEGGDIPTEVLDIQNNIERTAEVLRQLYQEKSPEKFFELFHELLSAAQLLAGPRPSPIVAAALVERIREKVVLREGKGKKTHYLNTLGGRLGIAVMLLLFIAFAATTWSDELLAMNLSIVTVAPYYAVLLAAATAAIWLSFASRKPRLSFDDLLEPEGDMMGPWHRIAYVGLFTGVLALFAEAGMIGVSIGDFSTGSISSDYISAAIFGFVCGFSEKLLSATVAPHVTHVISGLGKTST